MKSSRSPQPDGTSRSTSATEGGQPSDATEGTPPGTGKATPAANGGAMLSGLGLERSEGDVAVSRPDVPASQRLRVGPGSARMLPVAPAAKAALADFVAHACALADKPEATKKSEAPEDPRPPAQRLNAAAAKLGKQLEGLTPQQADEVLIAIISLAADIPHAQGHASATADTRQSGGFRTSEDSTRLSSSRAELAHLKEAAAFLPESTQRRLRSTFARADDRLTFAAIDRELSHLRFDDMGEFARFVASPGLSAVRTPMDDTTRAIFLKAAMARAGTFGLERPMEAATVLQRAFNALPDRVKNGLHGTDFDAAHVDLTIDQHTDTTLSDFEAMIGTPGDGTVPVFDQLQTDGARSRLLSSLVRKLPRLDADTRPAVHEMISSRGNELTEPYDAQVEDALADMEPRLLPDATRASISKSRALVNKIMDAPKITESTVEGFLADDALYGPDVPPDALGTRQQEDGSLWVGRSPRPKPLATLAERLADIENRTERKACGGRLLEATKLKVRPERNQVAPLIALAEASAETGPELFNGVLEHAGTLLEKHQIRAVDYRQILKALDTVRLTARSGEAGDTGSRLLAAKVKFAQLYPYASNGI